MGNENSRLYSVGDLVVNKFPLELIFDEYKIEEGEIGLIISIICNEPQNIDRYDYVVLIKGKEVFFFEQELRLYRAKEVTNEHS